MYESDSKAWRGLMTVTDVNERVECDAVKLKMRDKGPRDGDDSMLKRMIDILNPK